MNLLLWALIIELVDFRFGLRIGGRFLGVADLFPAVGASGTPAISEGTIAWSTSGKV
jgi:hypothetical protein